MTINDLKEAKAKDDYKKASEELSYVLSRIDSSFNIFEIVDVDTYSEIAEKGDTLKAAVAVHTEIGDFTILLIADIMNMWVVEACDKIDMFNVTGAGLVDIVWPDYLPEK